MNTTRRSANTLRSARGVIFALSSALALAACGSSGAPTATPGTTTPLAGATQGAGGATPTTDPGGGVATQGPGAASASPGAGGASPAPGTGAGTDACSVLSAVDITRITGSNLVTAVPAQQQGIFTNGCLYELNDGSTTTTINVGVMESGGRAYFDSQIATAGYESFPGLGDAAVNFRAGSVVALAGDTLVYAQYFGTAGPDYAVSTDVVRWMLANLGL